ncbi:L-rhamnose mutarotase [Allonocardiopsis opalescens]|uniref:L-rhamnose mutarotase n=1 Tax=Allonocardiopsis opalescens TaxID=1144618 RepID=A0A2T0PXY9_9ACTN|nr:L-rhamnose mutarotase [Allonocardiopsis opalescens]PRX96276.1 L-rhamnose mutarotase [Allonocardiopsis opalescens]
MRVAVHVRLRPGTEEAYDRAHREVPAELTAAMARAGARDWTVWRSGLDVFQLIECDDYPRLLAQLAEDPVNITWQRRMAELQEVTHDYSAAGADKGLPQVWRLP